MVNEHNQSPISLREGKVFMDGVEVLDSVSCTVTFVPDVYSGRTLGRKGTDRRWIGHDITGTITRRRSTPWLKEAIKRYLETGRTPEFTIQGLMNDKGSDYYERYGSDMVTVLGCVLTGDLPLTMLDSGGDVANETINFGGKEIV